MACSKLMTEQNVKKKFTRLSFCKAHIFYLKTGLYKEKGKSFKRSDINSKSYKTNELIMTILP